MTLEPFTVSVTPCAENPNTDFVSTFSPVLGHRVHALIGGDVHSSDQIVMIHGALASHRYLMPTAKILAQTMKVFIPELPGHGASSTPAHALSVEQLADVLYDWYKINKLERTHIFANSYGCQIASMLVTKYPEIVQTLTLSGPTCDPAARNFVQQAYRLYVDGFGEPKGSQDQLIADLSDMTIPIAYQTINRMIADDIRPRLPQIRCRTMVVRGERDTVAPQHWTEEVARSIANSKLFVIPGAPHCVNYASAGALTEIMGGFINEAA